MPNRTRLFFAACGGMFVVGIVLAILGVLFGLPGTRARLGVDLAQQGEILFILYFGFFLSTLVAGPAIDSFGNKVVLSISAALVAGALVLFAFASSFLSAVIAGSILGFGGGGLNTSSNALVADLYPEDRGSMLNILGMFYGAGALLMPFAAAVITNTPSILTGAAAATVLLGVVYLMFAFPAPRESVRFSVLASIKAAAYPGVLLMGTMLLCESGNEAAIGGWTSTYVGGVGASPRAATAILGGYWAALMAGRLAAAQILKRVSKPSLILASGIGSVIGSLCMLASQSMTVIAIGAVIVGFSFAAIYPTTLAIAADRYQRMAGSIFGFLFAFGLLGGMFFPWIVGQVAERQGIRAGMVVPMIGAIIITVIAFSSRERR